MMKKLMIIFGLLIAGAVCINVGLSNTEADDLAQLKRLNAKFIHNFVTNDAAAHDKIIHENFQYIDPNGKWVNRKDYLENWKTGFDPEKIIYWDYRFEKITIVGTTGLVRSVNKCIFLHRGKEITEMTQYTDTYVKEDGGWKCIQAQITTVAPENYPGDETIVKKYIKGKIQ